jgi:hypothetical protein
VIAVHARIKFRARAWDAGQPSQGSLARYAVQAGADPSHGPEYRTWDYGDPPNYNPGSGGSCWIESTDEWQTVSYTSLATARVIDDSYGYNSRQTLGESEFRANPPPLD